jgi:natural product biosynthesis luciferase-like monooxygenase protein
MDPLVPSTAAAEARRPQMDFGLMFFTSGRDDAPGFYKLLLDLARFIDQHQFKFVSTPERHFHRFGGPFPHPAVLSAAIAAVTENIQIRAGSLIAPLHHVLRMAEEWSIVDSISRGRVAISFGTGWNIDDFVLAPSAWEGRRELLLQQIKVVQQLWKTGEYSTCNPAGHQVSLHLYPRPVQRQLPVWLTVSRNPVSFKTAGECGFNVLTHMEGQDLQVLEKNIAAYRSARTASGLDPQTGTITLMQHTLLGKDQARTQSIANVMLDRYLDAAADLERTAVEHGGLMSAGRESHLGQDVISKSSVRDEMIEHARTRLCESASLIGTLEQCRERTFNLAAIGVDEIACLVDFVEDDSALWECVELLNMLRKEFAPAHRQYEEQEAIARFLSTAPPRA